MVASTKAEHTLVLCVDRDDDLGVKGKMETPILGRENNLNAAVNLALRDPEEPDANAIFEAVRIFDRLAETGEKEGCECQVATIAGSELGGVGADKKLVSEFNQVLKTFPATDIVLVVDGFTDEAILPLIQSRVPVTSVRRITVKHSQSIEETAWLFSRYLRMLFDTPRYARIALGLPGILIIILGVLTALRMLESTWIAFLLVLGSFLAIKGFGLDKFARSFYIWGLSQTSVEVSRLPSSPSIVSEWIGLFPKLAGWFIAYSITLVVIGICILLSGRAIRWFFERDNRLWRTIVVVVVVAWSSPVFYEASQVLINPQLDHEGRLVFTIVVSIIWAILAVLITSLFHRKYAGLFAEEEEVEEQEEKVEES